MLKTGIGGFQQDNIYYDVKSGRGTVYGIWYMGTGFAVLEKEPEKEGVLCAAAFAFYRPIRPSIAVDKDVLNGYNNPCRCAERVQICGCSSVVEHRLAKARVASSNLVIRSSYTTSV